VRTLSRLVLVIASVCATACIADKALLDGDKCPAEVPDGRVCQGAHFCEYGIYNLCPAGRYETECTCLEGLMSCDFSAGLNHCATTDVPQDTTTTDAAETDADVEVVDVLGQ
jgi:hypothetical protein